jgi:archaetidylinositol phosphate synthase
MSHDTWIHRVARVCVRPLLGTSVTPNHLTAARLASGIVAAALIASAQTHWAIVGCVVFLISMLLDRADGELARLSGRTTPGGHRFDLWTDAICDTLVVFALGVAQRDGDFGAWAIVMGIGAAACVALIFVAVLNIDKQLGPGSVTFTATAGFDPDDFIAIIPLSVVFGVGDWTLAAATVATPLAAIIVLWHLRKLLPK